MTDESICQWFAQVQETLSSHLQTAASACSLVPVDEDIELGVACPECGVYFASHRHVQSHRARQHGYKGSHARARPGVMSAVQYVSGSVGGLPECRHCRRVFTRAEGLKKHLKSGCPAKHANEAGSETAAGLSGEVPDTQVELPRGRAPQAVSDATVPTEAIPTPKCRTLNLPPLFGGTGRPS